MKRGFFKQKLTSNPLSGGSGIPSASGVRLSDAVPGQQLHASDAEAMGGEDAACPMVKEVKGVDGMEGPATGSRMLEDDDIQETERSAAEPVDSPSTSGRPAGSLEECLALLQSSTDERRLVGLLLATRFISSEDHGAVRKVFDAVGFNFINRLFKTGVSNGKAGREGGGRGPPRREGEDGGGGKAEYLHLALSITSAFCRIDELARRPEVVANVPLFVRLIRDDVARGRAELASDGNAELAGWKVDAYECLLATASASQAGREAALAAGAVRVVASDLGQSQPGNAWVPPAIRILAALLGSSSEDEGGADSELASAAAELASAARALARELASRDDGTKFEALSLLLLLLASDSAAHVREILRACSAERAPEPWAESARLGLGQLLHSHLGARERHLALQVTRALVEICGDRWLIGPMGCNPEKPEDPLPFDRFFLLVLEMVRVEIHVLLNDVARLMFASPEQSAALAEAGPPLQQDGRKLDTAARMLANCYALLEACIETLAASASERVAVGHEMLAGGSTGAAGSEHVLSSGTQQAALRAMDESAAVILDFIAHARDSGHPPNNDTLLASVRVLARYLADAPDAHRERVSQLLEFMLSATPTLEHTPIHAVGFLLPALQQIAEDPAGCDAIVRAGAHRALISLVSRLATRLPSAPAPHANVDLEGACNVVESACDVLLDVLAAREECLGADALNAADVVDALPALLAWYQWSCSQPGGQAQTVLTGTTMDIDSGGKENGETNAVDEHEAFVGRVVSVAISILSLSSEKEIGSFRRLAEAGGDVSAVLDMVVNYLNRTASGERASDEGGDESGTWYFFDVVTASCAECVAKYPSLRQRLVSSGWLQRVCKGDVLTPAVVEQCTDNPSVKLLLAALAGI